VLASAAIAERSANLLVSLIFPSLLWASTLVPDPAPDLELTAIAPGVWMHTSWREIPEWGRVRSNGLVVETETGVVLIDTAWTGPQTERLLAQIEVMLPNPVDTAIFTHAHADRMGGADVLHAAGIETWALDLTNELAPGRDLTPAQNSLDLEMGEASHVIPGLTIYYPGGGHSEDNIVVGIDAVNILFGGCLIRPLEARTLGNIADANLENWSLATGLLHAQFPAASQIIPSHGDPGTRTLLDITMSLAAGAIPED
jgi:metallo-beta-lactamase class B